LDGAGIQDCIRHLAIDQARTDAIAAEAINAYGQGRKVLVLTGAHEHLDAIQIALGGKVPSLFVLHGRIAKKQRATLIAELNALPPDAPRVLLATGKLVGEGFDHPRLILGVGNAGFVERDVAAIRGTTAPEHATKTDVRIIDFVDTGHQRCCGCGTSGSADTGRWDTELRNNLPANRSTRSNAHCFGKARFLLTFGPAHNLIIVPNLRQ